MGSMFKPSARVPDSMRQQQAAGSIVRFPKVDQEQFRIFLEFMSSVANRFVWRAIFGNGYRISGMG